MNIDTTYSDFIAYCKGILAEKPIYNAILESKTNFSIPVNIDQLNNQSIHKISKILGFNFEKLLIEELPEEHPEASGVYMNNGKGTDKIFLSHKFFNPGKEEKDTIESYFLQFICMHGKAYAPLSSNITQIVSHQVEDILNHEYGHKIYFERYEKEIEKWANENVPPSIPYVATFNEAFALWFGELVSGHQHPGDSGSLIEYYKEKNKKVPKSKLELDMMISDIISIGDGKKILEAYNFLVSETKEKGHLYILENFALIAVDYFEQRKEEWQNEIDKRLDLSIKLREDFESRNKEN